MQTALTMIWKQIIVSISYVSNGYTMSGINEQKC